jgi:purine-binding chemotaxis protein CheW
MSEAMPPVSGTSEWDALARAAAGRTDEVEGSDEIQQLLAFDIDGTPYAVRVERVIEIVRMRPVTPVPRISECVRGVVSLRGEIIEVIDMRLRLGLDPIEPTRRSRMIVVRSSSGDVAAILVDAVREVLRVTEDAIQPATGSESGVVESLCARGDEFVSLIELDRVLAIDA